MWADLLVLFQGIQFNPNIETYMVNVLNISEASESRNMWFPYICTSLYVTVQLLLLLLLNPVLLDHKCRELGQSCLFVTGTIHHGKCKAHLLFGLLVSFLSVYLFTYLYPFPVSFLISLSSPRHSSYVFNGYPFILMWSHKILWYHMHIF